LKIYDFIYLNIIKMRKIDMKKSFTLSILLFFCTGLFAAVPDRANKRLAFGLAGGYNPTSSIFGGDSTDINGDSFENSAGYIASAQIDYFSSSYRTLGNAYFVEVGYSTYKQNGETFSYKPLALFGWKHYFSNFSYTVLPRLSVSFGYGTGDHSAMIFGVSAGAAVKLYKGVYLDFGARMMIPIFSDYSPTQIPLTAGILYAL